MRLEAKKIKKKKVETGDCDVTVGGVSLIPQTEDNQKKKFMEIFRSQNPDCRPANLSEIGAEEEGLTHPANQRTDGQHIPETAGPRNATPRFSACL